MICDNILKKDIDNANAFLQASNLSCPDGNLELIFDERGNKYKIPVFCFSNPIEIVNSDKDGKSSGANDTEVNSARSVESLPHGPPVALKVRINPGDISLTIDISCEATIYDLKNLVCRMTQVNNLLFFHLSFINMFIFYLLKDRPELSKLTPEKQRIIFMGKELQNKKVIKTVGFDDVRVIQIFANLN